ncbi:hypothetical protein FOZ63_006065 [Perkinsus olseni]|uniref:Uncharacterized protein n=1 Tax=Perkinsus olseni TaxID=32597 RepID=A0A7J6QXP2_PEROL|nr:hypothetical protein FOZ63_006065 [Perkinsus olseni]
MSLLRRAACPQRLVPKRVCEAVKNPLIGGPNQKARGAITSGFAGGGAKRLGGKGYGIMADWCDHGYSFTKGQAITGMPHWPLWCGGGVPDKFIKIDPDVHFNLQGGAGPFIKGIFALVNPASL